MDGDFQLTAGEPFDNDVRHMGAAETLAQPFQQQDVFAEILLEIARREPPRGPCAVHAETEDEWMYFLSHVKFVYDVTGVSTNLHTPPHSPTTVNGGSRNQPRSGCAFCQRCHWSSHGRMWRVKVWQLLTA